MTGCVQFLHARLAKATKIAIDKAVTATTGAPKELSESAFSFEKKFNLALDEARKTIKDAFEKHVESMTAKTHDMHGSMVAWVTNASSQPVWKFASSCHEHNFAA